LENVVRKALLLARGFTITVEHIRSALTVRTMTPSGRGDVSLRDYVAELLAAAQRGEVTDVHGRLLQAAEKEVFSQAIQLAQGNQAKAARWLGVSRLTMREKLLEFGLHPARENEK
jgi:DNA-binding NtrC family response regulator